MFTGIVQAVGTVADIETGQGDLRLRIDSGRLDLATLTAGDSICTNGVCLTAAELRADGFVCDVSRETLDCSTLGELEPGAPVNLETALTPHSALGGHIVSGHVDGVASVVSHRSDARSSRWRMRAPDRLARYLARKGSVCIDGVSLTINAVHGSEFEMNIVPHTLAQTIFSSYRVGSRVNLEVDVIARYLERLLLGPTAADPRAAPGEADFPGARGPD